jgi:hypothetical protein
LNPFERALIGTRVMKGETIPVESLVKLDAHDREGIRLAELLHQHWFEELSPHDCVGIVYDLLAAYQPTVEWEDVNHGDTQFTATGEWGRFITANLRVGARIARYKMRVPPQMGDSTMQDIRRHIMRRVGVDIAEWTAGLRREGSGT